MQHQVVFLWAQRAGRRFLELANFTRVDDVRPRETRCGNTVISRWPLREWSSKQQRYVDTEAKTTRLFLGLSMGARAGAADELLDGVEDRHGLMELDLQ